MSGEDERKEATEETYISVSEYAKICGVSTAAVYKRLDKGLKPWYRVVNGKKCLLSSVLTEAQQSDVDNVDNHDSTKRVDSVDNVDNALIAELREQIAALRAETAAQREVIAEKDKLIADYGAKFADLAARNAELVDQAHRLNAAEKGMKQIPADLQAAQPTPAAQQPSSPGKKKRGFFARLFGSE